MKTGNAIILMTAVVLLVFVGLVAAEDFMMPQELDEQQTVIANNSTDSAAHSANVKRHVPPRGFVQNIVLIFWDPFGHAPVDNNGLKLYNNGLWYHYPDNTWIQVAFINENNQVTHIQVWDQDIVNNIKNNYQTADNVTVSMVEQPTTYDVKQSASGNNTSLNNSDDSEKINTTIKLDDQTLKNDTNTTIQGTLVDENGTAISDAEVTITVNGQSYTQTTDSNGQFSYEYNTESSDLTVGTNSMEVIYSGNETFNATSKTITVTLENVEETPDDTEESTETENHADSSSNYDNEYADNSDNYYSSDDDYYAVDNNKNNN